MTRVVGIGQPSAGDDGVGPFVIAQLRSDAPLDGELCVAREASALIELLKHPEPVYLVDAILVPERAGSIWEFSSRDAGAKAPGTPASATNAAGPLEDLARLGNSVSSHGLDVTQAIELCRALYPDEFPPELRVFAIAIANATPGVPLGVERAGTGDDGAGLSPAIRDASLKLAGMLRARLTSAVTPKDDPSEVHRHQARRDEARDA